MKLILWQIPVMKLTAEPHTQHNADRAWFEQESLGVRDPDGSLHRLRPSWFRGSYVWDPTNPASRDWWMAKRAYLLDDLGVDGFKTDGGEHLWGTTMQFGDGRRADELWNEYPQHYTEAYYQFAQKNNGVTFSRAGFTGSQRSPIHWAGDEASTWDAYRHSLLAGLSAGISGIPFWSYDIGGFSGDTPSAELYLRSAAQAAFCPVMQYHSENFGHREPNHDRTPWNIQQQTGDERVIPIFRTFVNVRHNLMPYIWQEAQHSAASGEPMMRALKLYDAQADDYSYQFGRDLLVYPVVEADAETRTLRLPPGDWVDFWSNTPYAGDQTITVSAPLDRIPVFVRAGARIPARLAESGKLGDFVPLAAEGNTWLQFQ
jgi:alpha-glucosidase (family GH31 glycosyl hydrolase)